MEEDYSFIIEELADGSATYAAPMVIPPCNSQVIPLENAHTGDE